MEGLLMMSAKKRERLKIFLRVKHGELQQTKVAALFPLDYRYPRRLYHFIGRAIAVCSINEVYNNRIELLCGVV